MFRGLAVSGRKQEQKHTSKLLGTACEVPSGMQVVALEAPGLPSHTGRGCGSETGGALGVASKETSLQSRFGRAAPRGPSERDLDWRGESTGWAVDRAGVRVWGWSGDCGLNWHCSKGPTQDQDQDQGPRLKCAQAGFLGSGDTGRS